VAVATRPQPQDDSEAPTPHAEGAPLRVLVLSERYAPEPNFITADVAARLARDAEVTAVVPHPSYPLGRFYDGVRPWRIARSREQGVAVRRVPFLPNQALSIAKRAASYLSYALSATVLAPFLAPRPDVVWVYHGPFTAALAALWFRFVRRSRLVITAADLWPESLTAAGVSKPGPLMNALYAYSRWINRRADAIICATQGTADRYHRDGIPRERLHVIPVWIPGVERFAWSPRETAADGFDVVYAGNLGPSQQLETLIRAGALLQDSPLGVRVHLYGAGASEQTLRDLAREIGARNVHFHGRVGPDEAFRACSEASAQVVSLRRSPEFRFTIPSKLAFSLAAATPILFALEAEPREIAIAAGALEFDPDDAPSLAARIEELARLGTGARAALRQRHRAYYERHFSPEPLLDEYARLILQPRAPRR